MNTWGHTQKGGDTIGYRIIGLAEGWTDDPALAEGGTP